MFHATYIGICVVLCLVLNLAAPASAQNKYPTPFGPASSETTKLGDGLYTFAYGGTRTIFVVTDEGVIVADPISTFAAPALKDAIAEVTDQPVKYVVYTHHHWDHMLGGQIFKDEGATFISHANCIAHFTRDRHPQLVMPDLTYETRHDITLGGRNVELHYFGRNHGNCLTVLLLPAEKILIVVDLAMPSAVVMASGYMRGDYPVDVILSIKAMNETIDFDRYMPGHGPPIADKSAMLERADYMQALLTKVRSELEAGTPFNTLIDEFALPGFEHLRGYDTHLKRNARRILTY